MAPDDLRSLIRDIPDYPEPGIVFRDITPMLRQPGALSAVVDRMIEPWREVDVVVGIESRGFILGAPMAPSLGAGFVPVRKPGKLPYDTIEISYDLEYGTDSLELHVDAVAAGERVLIVDDVLATGGTAAATIDLVQRAGATVVGCAFMIEIAPLQGRARLGETPVDVVLTYP
ncbi:MAG: adenine phosphoribosyltransferase [Acidimicrobiia bacterium]|nr:adenine phosphoribosyltransferase [Acidimicrobiia bacterium]